MSPTEPLSQPGREAWWRRMSRRMDRASLGFSEQVRDVVLLRRDLDESFWDDLLQVLVGADCGLPVAERLVERLRTRVREERMTSAEEALRALQAEMLAVLEARDRRLLIESVPAVVIMVGVNGSGKTTTIGKLAHRLQSEGRTVLIAAADTFRAAAIDQMRLWADRSNTPFIAHQPGGDPGAVVYDALQSAVARGIDVVLVDTAGRLHTKVNLMAELIKVRNVARRVIPEAPHETLLVIEAPTGMNAIAQARVFHEALGLTGIVLTKLDGTSRGGTVLAIEEDLGLPVKLVGLGEGIDDLNVFDPKAYLDALFAGVLEAPGAATPGATKPGAPNPRARKPGPAKK
jgi:fused signal recognition particle receptor